MPCADSYSLILLLRVTESISWKTYPFDKFAKYGLQTNRKERPREKPTSLGKWTNQRRNLGAG